MDQVHAITQAAVAVLALLAFIGFIVFVWHLTQPSCWLCSWCGRLYRKDGSTVLYGDADSHTVSHGMCPECQKQRGNR